MSATTLLFGLGNVGLTPAAEAAYPDSSITDADLDQEAAAAVRGGLRNRIRNRPVLGGFRFYSFCPK